MFCLNCSKWKEGLEFGTKMHIGVENSKIDVRPISLRIFIFSPYVCL